MTPRLDKCFLPGQTYDPFEDLFTDVYDAYKRSFLNVTVVEKS